LVAALTADRVWWTAVPDAVRLGPAGGATAVTAGQLRDVAERLIRVGRWRPGGQHILIVTDAGHDVMGLAWQLADLPAVPPAACVPTASCGCRSHRASTTPKGGRPPEHGPGFRLAEPEHWPGPAVTTAGGTLRCGRAGARARDCIPGSPIAPPGPAATVNSRWPRAL
jgi:hypothetical protein